MKNIIKSCLITVFFTLLFTITAFARLDDKVSTTGTTIYPGTYYQKSETCVFEGDIWSGVPSQITTYGEDTTNFIIISEYGSMLLFHWDTGSGKMSGTLTKNVDGTYNVLNDSYAAGNDYLGSIIESITPVSESEIVIYNITEGDEGTDNYFNMVKIG